MQEEMTRAQDSSATNYATTAQAVPLPHPKPPVPTHQRPCAPSGVLRAALETGWANPNAEGGRTRRAGRRRSEPCTFYPYLG